ncbi:hypothetical protein [Chroococcus sp. FPU101]|nr:hypothetical protein [Chroococcus sp. FPU101]
MPTVIQESCRSLTADQTDFQSRFASGGAFRTLKVSDTAVDCIPQVLIIV